MTPPTHLRRPLVENARRVRERIAAAARRCGRSVDSVELLPVTKSVPATVCSELLELGFGALGEARIAALEAKAEILAERGARVRWHFVGHVQRNKARRVVELAEVIHSVDSVRLLEALDHHARSLGRRPALYLQVNLTGEEHKHGVSPEELEPLLDRAASSEQLELLGLMAMGPLRASAGRGSAEVFEQVAALARSLENDPVRRDGFAQGRCRLSMGMSGDFEQAVAAGSDLVRVGGALFQDLEPAPPGVDEETGR